MPSPTLQHVVYVSKASADFGPETLEAILEVSRARNGANRVTGMLIYNDGRFLQYFEGAPAAAADTLARIRRDTRHHDVEVLIDAPTEKRLFGKWSMGCVDVGGEHWQRIVEANWPTIDNLGGPRAEGVSVLAELAALYHDPDPAPVPEPSAARHGGNTLGAWTPAGTPAHTLRAQAARLAVETRALKTLRGQVLLLIVFLIVLTGISLALLGR